MVEFKKRLLGCAIAASGVILMIALAPLGLNMKPATQALFVIALSTACASTLLLGTMITWDVI